MNSRKTLTCLVLVVFLVFVVLTPRFPAAGNDGNNGGNNDDGNGGSGRAGEDLVRLLVLFTGPQNWDYAGVMGVEDAEVVSLEQTSTEDIF